MTRSQREFVRPTSAAEGSDAPACRPPWDELMAAVQAGDALAYRRLLTGLRGWLTRYYSPRLPAGLVEDAVQETLLAVHMKRHTYAPDRPLGPWVAAIARYKWIDRLRGLSRLAEEALDEDGAGTPDGGDAVISAVVLNDLLGKLKPAQSAVIRLVKLRGYSVAEAAAVTGQSPSLVKVNIHRGLARLRAALGPEERPV